MARQPDRLTAISAQSQGDRPERRGVVTLRRSVSAYASRPYSIGSVLMLSMQTPVEHQQQNSQQSKLP